MTSNMYRYKFAPSVDMEDVRASLILAILGAEALHGEPAVRLESCTEVDEPKRSCEIEASTQVGRDLNRLFLGFLGREYGPDAIKIDQVDTVVSVEEVQS